MELIIIILLTYVLIIYIWKLFKGTFYNKKKNEKVINFVTIFSNFHKTISQNKWLMHALLKNILMNHKMSEEY